MRKDVKKFIKEKCCIKKEDGKLLIHSLTDDSLICSADFREGIQDTIIGKLAPLGLVEVYGVVNERGYGCSADAWYAWDNNNLHKFAVGTVVTKGNVAFRPSNKEDFVERTVNFWKTPIANGVCIYSDVYAKDITDEGFKVVCRWSLDPSVVVIKFFRGKETEHEYLFPESFGKGEWTAETMEDARAMAEDFIRNTDIGIVK